MPFQLDTGKTLEKINLTDKMILTIRFYSSGCTTYIFEGNNLIDCNALPDRAACIKWAYDILIARFSDYAARATELITAAHRLR
jgi:hypothetical protein